MSGRGKTAELVSLENVTVERGHALLRRVSWRLGEGELWAIAGRNGAGKSTLLRVLREEIPTTRGEVHYWFSGERQPQADDEIVQVSFDAQTRLVAGGAGYAQSRWHSGEDDGASRGRDVLGPARGMARGRRLVQTLGLAPLLGRRVTELSNGERRKLLLARAAADGPAILALDNPFAGLDRRSRRTFASALRRLHQTGTSVVILTAREDEILACVTHVLLLDRGRVAACGPRAQVLSDERFQRAMRPTTGSKRKRPRPVRASPSATAPVVELRNVCLRYDGVHVLERINWTVRSGERWVVVGQNGAGKSALLSLVLADNPQVYSNDVSLFGRRRGSGETIWEIKKRIGCISPELGLFHGRANSAIEVVCSGLHDSIGLYRKPSPLELRTATRWLERLGIARCRERRFGELCEGERQLVLLGRALVKEPELLVLDEPCQGLDDHHRRRFLDLLDRLLNRTRATLIYVTHDLEEIPATATHGLVLRRGRRIRQGPAETVLASYFGRSRIEAALRRPE